MDDFNNQLQTVEPTEHKKSRAWIAWLLLVILVGAGVFRAGYSAGRSGITFQPKSFKIVNEKDQSATVDYSLLWEALKAVEKNYIDKDNIDQRKVLFGAVSGAVAAAGDEYTQFFDQKDLENFRTSLSGSFDGIGAEVGKKDGNIVIIAPLPDTPAERAGLLAKDIIVSINGESTAEMGVDEAVTKIRGRRGTQVTLSIFREGADQPYEVKITRDTITIKSVKWEYKTVGDKNVAVITLSRFGDDTETLLDKAISEISSRKVDGLVIDLRNDPGGYLESAVSVASQWVPKDQLVVTEDHSNGQSIPYKSSGFNRLARYKTVVLINGGSASASEILAGALQDHKIATLIGEKSFGKGSVQQLFELPDETAVKVTVAKWITPGGKNLNKEGLHPDIEVKMSEEDITAKRDPQLDRALQEVVK